jgi:Tol biopolymer transport system component/DNA-binding winged helix-turn-helix (wHTH) protein
MNRRPDLPKVLISVDLTREPDFAIGALKVCPSLRQVNRNGEHETVQPRVMQVLVALFRAEGSVVSREDLIESCWDGVVVGDDAINRCIAKVRQISEFGPGPHFEIETIPRVGYRLIPSVRSSEPIAPAPVSQSLSFSIPSPRRQRVMAILLLAVVALSSGAVIWRVWPNLTWHVVSTKPFLDTLSIERYPAISPDGNTIAYSASSDSAMSKILIRSLAGGDSVRIISDAYDDIAPTWAADGVQLAYVGYRTGEPCRIFVTRIADKTAREVARCNKMTSTTLSWQPNSSVLYFTDLVDGYTAIFRLNLENGARERVTNIADPDASDPVISPDGKWLLYQEFASLTQNTVHIRNLRDKRDKTLGLIAEQNSDQVGAAWTSDSNTVLLTKSPGFGTEIWAFPIDGDLPYIVYATSINLGRISLSRGGVMAAEVGADRINLARAHATSLSVPDVIDNANGHSWSPTYSRDGTLAFISNRSGQNAIWKMKQGSQPFQILSGKNMALDRLRWSPDGTKIAFVVGTDKGVTIRVIASDGRPVTSFDMPSIGYGMPTWTPDSGAIISFDSSILTAVQTQLENTSRHIPVAPRLWDGITTYRGATFSIRADKPGIWQIDNGIHEITQDYAQANDSALVFKGNDILIAKSESRNSAQARIMAQPIAGGPPRIFAYAPLIVKDSDIATNPLTGEVVYAARTVNDTNIDLFFLATQ